MGELLLWEQVVIHWSGLSRKEKKKNLKKKNLDPRLIFFLFTGGSSYLTWGPQAYGYATEHLQLGNSQISRRKIIYLLVSELWETAWIWALSTYAYVTVLFNFVGCCNKEGCLNWKVHSVDVGTSH